MPAVGKPEPDPETALPAACVAARAVVLLVDDDASIQDSVGALLDFLGFEPIIAATGEAALDLLEGGLQPAVTILDMDMPGLGGAGTLPRLRALRPDLPVVISTGRVNLAVLELVRRYPGVSLMPKPFSLADLKGHLA
ncbi:response regulator [Geothrix sp. SG200]|uniref:response regulator n=1 Tax=Geothrix sp. SG200 TaxID=2922865 RepID=UPI001FADBE22|nr:response regulator [Geothrix sp. SG200]